MQLYLLSNYEQLDSKRLGKQMVEALQVYNVAAMELSLPRPHNKQGKPYRETHANHPITRWACRGVPEAMFCLEIVRQCGEVWYDRYGKHHACLGQAEAVMQQLGATFDEAEFPNEYIVLRTGYATTYTNHVDKACWMYADYLASKD